MNNRTLVIIPTYNEKDNARHLIDLVLAQAEELDILVVDDNSPDGTAEIVEKIAQETSRVHLLKRPGKLGLGTAYIDGFKWGLANGYELLMEMDADFSHDPQEIPNFLRAMTKADLTLGSRYINGIRIINWSLGRLMLSRFASFYVQWITGLPINDPTGGFKCFHRSVLEAIDLDRIRSNGYAFQIEMTHKAWVKGFSIIEIPITFTERCAGSSKMSGGIVQEALFIVWLLAFANGFRRSPRPLSTSH